MQLNNHHRGIEREKDESSNEKLGEEIILNESYEKEKNPSPKIEKETRILLTKNRERKKQHTEYQKPKG